MSIIISYFKYNCPPEKNIFIYQLVLINIILSREIVLFVFVLIGISVKV
jgi:hypothetical protein